MIPYRYPCKSDLFNECLHRWLHAVVVVRTILIYIHVKVKASLSWTFDNVHLPSPISPRSSLHIHLCPLTSPAIHYICSFTFQRSSLPFAFSFLHSDRTVACVHCSFEHQRGAHHPNPLLAHRDRACKSNNTMSTHLVALGSTTAFAALDHWCWNPLFY